MISFENKYNWYALAVSILGNCIPEMAFLKLEMDRPDRAKMRYSKNDIEDMHKIKSSGLTYKELAEIYCSTPDCLYHVMNRARKSGAISV